MVTHTPFLRVSGCSIPLEGYPLIYGGWSHVQKGPKRVILDPFGMPKPLKLMVLSTPNHSFWGSQDMSNTLHNGLLEDMGYCM